MAVRLTHKQQYELLQELKTLSRSIVITGELQSKLDHKIPHFDVIVDTWPDFQALVLIRDVSSKENTIMIYAKDPARLKYVLKQPNLVDWTRKIKIAAFDTLLYTTVHDVVSQQMETIRSSDEFRVLTVTREALRLRPVPESLTLSSLRPDQCDLVNSNWIRKGEGTVQYIRNLLETFPSACLYSQNGEVLGYVLAYHYGCVGMLHVPEEHRGRGYAKVIVTQLAEKCLQTSDCVYVLIEASNTVSLQLHQSLGFEIVDDFAVCWITAK